MRPAFTICTIGRLHRQPNGLKALYALIINDTTASITEAVISIGWKCIAFLSVLNNSFRIVNPNIKRCNTFLPTRLFYSKRGCAI